MARKILSFRYVFTTILTLAIVILGGLNVQQKRRWIPPDDGSSWILGANGVQAALVAGDGPSARAGIRRGDRLLSVNGHAIRDDRHVTQLLYELGAWTKATYSLERSGVAIDTTVIIAPQPEEFLRRQLYLEIIGMLYLVVGIFVLTKRFNAPRSLHFYAVCLASFVLYVFHATGKFNDFDWAIFWFDTGAYLLLPPMFLHFCMGFPLEKKWSKRTKGLVWLVYLPGLGLMLTWIAFVTGVLGFIPTPLVLRDWLNNLTDFHLGLYFVVAAAVLGNTYRTVRTPELRQQMKWVTRGTVVAVLPYFLLQSVPRLFGQVPAAYVDIAVFPLVLIPLSFGYAIHRYRLMDVDIIFKRGVSYTLATALVLGLYVTFVVLVGELFGSALPGIEVAARVGATIIAAILFSPTKDQIQVWLDKVFYRDRYNLRQTLIDFGRTLGAEVHLEPMLDRIVDRLGRALMVDRMVVFLEDPRESGKFDVARVVGLTVPATEHFPFLTPWTRRPYLFFEQDIHDLNYFVPCRVKDKVIAYIGMGKTRNGDYLTSEDLELLEAVSDYIGIAVENAALYDSLERKAEEYQTLKDFNENIVESISVGVIAEDVQGRIVGWNRALEGLTGMRSNEILGRRTDEILPPTSLRALRDRGHLYKHRWDDLIVNLTMTPLVDKSGITGGRLIIVDNITERVRLEDQLFQNEKLTSIGLLAAGVAHEVNTPLAVISSYTQLLRKQMSPEDSRSKLLDKVITQTFRASEIVNSLLNFSRTAATEFGEVDLHQLIGETLSLLDHQFEKARIQIGRDFEAEDPVISGNPGKLQQVFLNLFLNARDAMTGGGELKVRTHTVDSKLVVSVEDSGSGISPESVKKIYDPFFTTKAAGKGTGLGLSVSYGIIQEHGGNISVDTAPGRGTTFKLELPQSRKAVNV